MRRLPQLLVALVLLCVVVAVYFVLQADTARSPIASGSASSTDPHSTSETQPSSTIERPSDAGPAQSPGATSRADSAPPRPIAEPPPQSTARFLPGLRGVYHFDRGLATDSLAVQLADPADPVARPTRLRAPVSFDGAWELAHCPPGTFDVRLELEHATDAIHVERAVVLEDRETPALEVDLRGVLRPCTLDVFDAFGAPVREAIASFYSSDGTRQSSVVVREGHALAILIRPPVAVEVIAQRHRPFVLDRVDGDLRIDLRGALPVTFSIAPAARLPVDPHQLQCELEPDIQADPALTGIARTLLQQRLGLIDDLVFSVDGTNRGGIDIALPLPGRYRVTLRVQDVSTGVEEPLAVQNAQVFDVLELPRQAIEIAVDASALEAASARLAKPR